MNLDLPKWITGNASLLREAKNAVAEYAAKCDVSLAPGDSILIDGGTQANAVFTAMVNERIPRQELESTIEVVKTEVVQYLAKHPELMRDLSPRQFEELIADIFIDKGCDVRLTPATRDGGRDLLVFFTTPFGTKQLAVVECKRYRADRTIGVNIARAFLYVIDRTDGANCGIIATTSFFSSEVRQLAKTHEYRLHLRDFNGVTEWLSQYGKWSRGPTSGIWIPSDANSTLKVGNHHPK